MKDITDVKRMENGLALYYGGMAAREFVSFNYSELIDMKINALDLLENPNYYGLDVDNRQIISKK